MAKHSKDCLKDTLSNKKIKASKQDAFSFEFVLLELIKFAKVELKIWKLI